MEIEVIVESDLHSGNIQGTQKISLPSDSSVEYLLNMLCHQSHIPVSSKYILRNARSQVLDKSKTLHDSDVINGSVLCWTDESAVKVAHCRFNTWWFLSLLAFVIGLVGLVALSVFKTREATQVFEYGIVFDAGSSHTSMYIYRWSGSKLNNTAIAAQYTKTVSPPFAGLASLTDDLQTVRTVITQCLDQAKQRIPAKKHKQTPVYLGATAGMRLLHESNNSASELVLNTVRDSISKYPFKFNRSNARIISGAEEGTFSWITSNYIAGVFHVTPPAKIIESTKTLNTSGALDLGGASTQITFAPEDATMPANYSVDVRLYGHAHRVYTHSFLCYGVNEARRRLRAELVTEQNYSATILNPCLPKGFNTTVSNHSDIFNSWCVNGFHAQQAFGSVIEPGEDVDQNASYIFKGESNATKCAALVEKHLFSFKTCNFTHCSFNNQFQPPVTGNFWAFSSFFYVTRFLNLTDGTRQFSMKNFQNTVSAFCNKTWAEIKPMVAVKNQSKPYYCFQATLINILLTKGYKFNSTNWNTLKFVKKVAGTNVGWALGFILKESNHIPGQKVKVLISMLTFSLLISLFAIFILIALGFACHARKYHRRNQNQQYQKLSGYGSM